jgi:DNA-binding protein HU-beta
VNSADLVERLAERTGLTRRAARAVLDVLLSEIVGELAANRSVTMRGFGTFDVAARPARKWRHPTSGELLTSAPGRTVAFRAGSELKNALLDRSQTSSSPRKPGEVDGAAVVDESPQ